MKYMLEDLHSQKPKSFFNHEVLYSDASVIMIGGTDTIAALLSYAFYELAKNPAHQTRLRAAVASSYGNTILGEFVDRDLETVDYLNAFINEVLRLYSPVCNNGQRTTPPEGIVVDGTFIPGNTQLIVPIHSINLCRSILQFRSLYTDSVRQMRSFMSYLMSSLWSAGLHARN